MGMFLIYNGERFYFDHLSSHSANYEFTSTAWDAAIEKLQGEMGIVFGDVIKKVFVWSYNNNKMIILNKFIN